MSLSYFEVVSALYGTDEFSSGEFRRAVNSPRAARTLGELKRRGLLARVGHGRYRVLSQVERPDPRAAEYRRVWGVVRTLPCRFAWAGPTAIEVWTNGAYHAPPSMALRELHVEVARNDLSDAARYLRRHRVAVASKKRIGSVVHLHPVSSLRVVFRSGEPVISRAAVETFIREHSGLFGAARPWLNDRSR